MGKFRKLTDVVYMIVYLIGHSTLILIYLYSGCILIYSNFRLLAQDKDPEWRLLAQDTDPECLGFAIRFPAQPK